MILGFIGHPYGMTQNQKENLHTFLSKHKKRIKQIYLGDFVGCEEEFFNILLTVDQDFRNMIVLLAPAKRRIRALMKAPNTIVMSEDRQIRFEIVKKCTHFILSPSSRGETKSKLWMRLEQCKEMKKHYIVLNKEYGISSSLEHKSPKVPRQA